MGKVKVECSNCGKDVYKFPSEIRCENNYCNRECFKQHKLNRLTVPCDNCGKDFTKRASSFNYKTRFCSNSCKYEYASKTYVGENSGMYGKKHTPETKKLLSDIVKNKGLKGEKSPLYERYPVECNHCGKTIYKIKYLIERSENQFCSVECHGKWKSENLIGENSPKWNPNISEEDRINGRKYPEYTEFVKEVMRRDKWTCDVCGCIGNKLNVHHLNGYGWDIENRTNPDNGITLCVHCHTDFHIEYGFGNNTREQYYEYKTSTIESGSFSITQ